MLWAVLITFTSVVVGTALALLPKTREPWMGPVRTFALTAAFSVVVVHLLPNALLSVGALGLLIFVAGLASPELLGKAGEAFWTARKSSKRGESGSDHRRNVALEASYVGLLLHQVGDGVGLGAFTGEMNAVSGSAGVVVAIAAHSVPVVAIMVLSFDSVHGRGSALSRAVGLALASIIGVWISGNVPHDSVAEASAYISAFVAGTLLHVVMHDLAVDLPRTFVTRWLDLLAAALGIYVSLLGGHSHHHEHLESDGTPQLIDALSSLLVRAGPLFVVGLALSALLAAIWPRIPERWFARRGILFDALRGTACGISFSWLRARLLPAAPALLARGCSPSFLVALLLSSSALSLPTLALSVFFLGWELSLFRALGAGMLACMIALFARRPLMDGTGPGGFLVSLERDEASFFRRFIGCVDELMVRSSAWMLVGVVAAALLQISLPEASFSESQSLLVQFSWVSFVLVPGFVSPPSATLVAMVLIDKGLSPAALGVGLLLGPMVHLGWLGFIRRGFGWKALGAALCSAVLFSWLLGALVSGFLAPTAPWSLESHPERMSGTWGAIAALLSGLVALRSLYKNGARGLLRALSFGHERDHLHGHGHGDDHGHVIASAPPGA